MKKKLAIVMGASGYLGQAIVSTMSEGDWTVARLARTRDDDDALSYACDARDATAVHEAVTEIVERHGPIFACVFAPALPVDGKTPILSMTLEAYEEQIVLATRGVFLFAKACIPHMAPRAAFIGITSTLAEPQVTARSMGSYLVAKYALRGFLRSLSADINDKSVRVHAVAPGYLPGGLNEGVPEAAIAFLGKKTGAGSSTGREVAEVVRKICDDPDTYPQATSIAVPGSVSSL